jgi:hypothetical protein
MKKYPIFRRDIAYSLLVFFALLACFSQPALAQKNQGRQSKCLPLSTNWRLSPELNHATWLNDTLGCDGTRRMIIVSDQAEDFREMLMNVGREFVHNALGSPFRSYINSARNKIDVYAISCEVEGDGQGLDASFIYDRAGCLREIFFMGR